MRLSFHFTLLFLTLLCPVPRTVTPYPHSLNALLPVVDVPQLDSALLHHRAPLDDQGDDWLAQPDGRLALLKPGKEKERGPWGEEALLRTQRGDLVARLLSPFPRGHSLEGLHHQEGGEGGDGGKRNEALTSIAGGLQAVSREKGGFGFRFGRKRWSDRG